MLDPDDQAYGRTALAGFTPSPHRLDVLGILDDLRETVELAPWRSLHERSTAAYRLATAGPEPPIGGRPTAGVLSGSDPPERPPAVPRVFVVIDHGGIVMTSAPGSGAPGGPAEDRLAWARDVAAALRRLPTAERTLLVRHFGRAAADRADRTTASTAVALRHFARALEELSA